MVDFFTEPQQTAQPVYKVTRNSASGFERKGQSITGRPDVYRAIPANGNKFCIAEVTYPGASGDAARKGRETLKAGK
jgi:hypothetical protein